MLRAVPRNAGRVAVDALAFNGWGSNGAGRSAKGLCSSIVDTGVVTLVSVLKEPVPTDVAIEFSLEVKDELETLWESAALEVLTLFSRGGVFAAVGGCVRVGRTLKSG